MLRAWILMNVLVSVTLMPGLCFATSPATNSAFTGSRQATWEPIGDTSTIRGSPLVLDARLVVESMDRDRMGHAGCCRSPSGIQTL